MSSPSSPAQSTSINIKTSFFSLPHIIFWAVLSTGTHLSIHTLENVELYEPEKSALVMDIENHQDKEYQFGFFYKWMVKEIKKDAARGETIITRTMNWSTKSKQARFSKELASRMARDVATKLRANGLDANWNNFGDVIVELEQ